MARRVLFAFCILACCTASVFSTPSDDESTIRELTSQFCSAVVRGDLSVLDQVFDGDPSNVYYDINEGPMVGLERLKRIWRAATRNARLSSFEFHDDMRIDVDGTRALQTGTWTQEQVQEDGSSREIRGRATILWKKGPDGWKVHHYHGSITPPRQR